MNILLIAQVSFPTTIGGAGRYVYTLATGLAARGHRVVVLALGDSADRAGTILAGEGVPTTDGVSADRAGTILAGEGVSQVAGLPTEEVPCAAQRTAKQDEPGLDGVQVMRCGSLHRWWQVPAALLSVRRVFQELDAQHPFELISIHQPLLALALLGDWRARRLPWVYHFHSPWAEEARIWRRIPWWDAVGQGGLWLRWLIEHLVVRQARRCVTLSESMRAMLLAAHRLPTEAGTPPAGGVADGSADTRSVRPTERVRVIPGCVDLTRFQPTASQTAVRRELGLPLDRPILLTVRNLVPRMNLDGLIRAMRLVVQERPEALLLIGGSGPLAASLQALTRSLGLEDRVRLLGKIPEEQLVQWYQAVDLFVMPSMALEGFGLATLEALACGTPVVGTPIGGTTELLTDLDPSLLCAGTDPQAIASTILRTLTRVSDPQVREDLSARCRTFASRFSHQTMVETLDRTYRDLGRVRVLHVHTLPVVSGSGLNTLLSMQGQRDAGYDVELACAPGGPLLGEVERAGLVARPVRHLVQPVDPFHDLLAVVELWRLIRSSGYTIVHTHNSKAGFIGRLAAKLAGAPVIIHTVHGFAFHAYERWWRRQLFRALERMAARWCDHLIMISEPLITWALEVRIAPREQMTKIYSGIDLDAFRRPVDPASLRGEFGFRDQEFIVGQVAKLWPGKGHEVLFHAAARLKDRLPRLRLLVIGEGELRATLHRLAQELDISDRVIFAGFRSDIAALTHLFDVAVLPSLFEGMGRAILEAQAAGKPVIASRVGGTPDLIRDGVNGCLVEPGNVEALAGALCRLYEQPQLRRALGQTAQQMMDRRFEARTMVEQIVSLYDTLRERKLGMAHRR